MDMFTILMDPIPVIPSIYVGILSLIITRIPNKWVRYLLPIVLAVLLSFISPFVQEFRLFLFYTVIALAIVTPIPLFIDHFKLRWKMFFILFTAFNVYLLILFIGFSYTFGGEHPLISLFPLFSVFPWYLIHYFEGLIISMIVYPYLLIIDRIIDYLGHRIKI